MGLCEKLMYYVCLKKFFGEKICAFSRLNYVMFIKKIVISFKRCLFFILIFIIFVIVMLYNYIKLFIIYRIVIVSQRVTV